VPVAGRRRLFAVDSQDLGTPVQQMQPLDVEGQLLVQVAAGDVAAFDELYARCSPVVYGMVLQVLRDPSQAEEVAQEVLVEVWRTAGRFDIQRGSARSWLLTMARRRAIDRVRAAQAAADRDVRVGLAATTPEFDEVTETVWNRLEQEQVRRCLDRLSGLQRQAIELAFYRGQSHREVSDTLRVPLGTVKTRLRDGLIRLRDCLGVEA
jgi:RNA polymerase sigma-70 factor, ECF subfamily